MALEPINFFDAGSCIDGRVDECVELVCNFGEEAVFPHFLVIW